MALSRQNAGVRCFGIAEAAYAPVRAPCDVHASRRQLVATVERDQQAGLLRSLNTRQFRGGKHVAFVGFQPGGAAFSDVG